MFKRVSLFLLTNLLVIALVSIVTSVLGIQSYLTKHGINYTALAIFTGLWGMGGAFISLWLSKFMAKKFAGVQLIDPAKASPDERQLVETIHRLARKAGLSKMPEVGIYESPEVNAFATGPSRRNSLVAVSTGLLSQMNETEVEGVLSHEVSHIANGDMVTMTLLQGVLNSFALFLSRIVAYVVSLALSDSEEGGGFSYIIYFILTIVFDILFTFLGSFVTAAYSRWREFHADADGAKLGGKHNMVAALRKLQAVVEVQDQRAPAMAALKISRPRGLLALLSTHPPLDERIKRLERGGY